MKEDYSDVDTILYPWAQSHGLHVRTAYKGEDVRSLDVGGKSGKLYQLWLDAPNEKNQIHVYAWDYKHRKTDVLATISTLDNKLDEVYSSIQNWDLEFAAELRASG